MIMAQITSRKSKRVDRPRPLRSLWLDVNRGTLPTDQWVAVGDAGMIACSPTQLGLMDELKDKHVDLSSITITFVTSGSI